MATPVFPTIPGFTPDERANCRVVEYTSSAPNVAPLPALVVKESGEVLSRWKLSPQERLQAYLAGDIYVWTHTHGQLLQPLQMHAERPALTNAQGEEKLPVEETPGGHVPQFGVLFDILQERARQEETGGYKRYPPELWPAIVIKQCGDVANAVIHTSLDETNQPQLRASLVRLAAIAMAWLEAIDDPEGTGEGIQTFLAGDVDDALRRMVSSWGAASVIHSLSKAARAESLNLSLNLSNMAFEYQERREKERQWNECPPLKRPMSITAFNAELRRRFQIIVETPLREGESLLWIGEPIEARNINPESLIVKNGGRMIAGYAEDESDCDGEPQQELTLSAIDAITSEFTIMRDDGPRDFDFGRGDRKQEGGEKA